MRLALLSAVALVGLAGIASAATYNGNGGASFGGPVGNGNLEITQSGDNLTFSLNTTRPGGLDQNNLVIYISTGAAGLVDTRGLIATGNPPGSDAGNTAISGYNNFSQNPPSRTVLEFPAGFQALYAFSFANDFDGLFKLNTDGSGGLQYITGAAPVTPPGGTAPFSTLTVPLSTFGLTAGQSFQFVASLIDGRAAFRSNEAIGDATINGQNLATVTDQPGFNNLITFSSARTFNTVGVPEPTTMMGLSVVAGALLARRRAR